jgi:hypothetical protein
MLIPDVRRNRMNASWLTTRGTRRTLEREHQNDSAGLSQWGDPYRALPSHDPL